jgi:hypothetical protein
LKNDPWLFGKGLEKVFKDTFSLCEQYCIYNGPDPFEQFGTAFCKKHFCQILSKLDWRF